MESCNFDPVIMAMTILAFMLPSSMKVLKIEFHITWDEDKACEFLIFCWLIASSRTSVVNVMVVFTLIEISRDSLYFMLTFDAPLFDFLGQWG